MTALLQEMQRSSLFDGFTEVGVKILAQIANERDLPVGMSLFIEGAPADSAFILAGGELEVIVGRDAAARSLCTIGPGEHLGELSLLRAGRRGVTARAKTACRVIEIRRTDFGQLLQQKPQACIKLMMNVMAAVEKRIDAVRPQLLAMARASAADR